MCQIDFSSNTEDGNQIGQRTGISKIVENHCCHSQKSNNMILLGTREHSSTSKKLLLFLITQLLTKKIRLLSLERSELENNDTN